MLVINSAPIRQKARKDYDKIVRDLERARIDLEHFRTHDQPQYAKWLNSHFGAHLTENRELQEKLFQTQTLVREVQEEFYFGEHDSIYAAYTTVLRRRDNPEEFAKEEEEAEKEETEFAAEFEEMFGKSAEELFEKLGIDPEEMAGAGSAPRNEPPSSGRLKDLYRALARRLHPDMGGTRSQKEIEWWHQTQTAYQEGDLEQLELILTLAEIEENGTQQASVSILQQIIDQFKHGLNALKRELKEHRRDAAWNFSRLGDYEALKRRTLETFVAEKQKLKAMLERFQTQIQAWEALQRPARKRSRRRGAMQEQDPWF